MGGWGASLEIPSMEPFPFLAIGGSQKSSTDQILVYTRNKPSNDRVRIKVSRSALFQISLLSMNNFNTQL